ncbi:response regulator transcription factor [Ideonella sp. 4Y11]|uniref:Response regulator transcription factor n=1 Tax=Ideonella aquatica TaxID=2824119 RepID=A0A940YGE9_9BURK|nr:response regulator transcription factor [Ideonella aquatica]MBQ0958914.1 response regulator transcription factor [Ideonella aquatica]
MLDLPAAPPPIRVALADDHAVVREGYRRLLMLEPDLTICGEFADADAVFAALQRGTLLADVLVLDLSMPGRSALDLLRRIQAHWPELRVLVFSMHEDPARVQQALRAGALGYITKSSPPEDLVAAVRHVARGQAVLSADIASHAQTPSLPLPHLSLTAREFEVLRGLLQGQSLEQIAEQLHISSKTVSNLQTQLRQKLGVGNAVELLRYAQQHGISP